MTFLKSPPNDTVSGNNIPYRYDLTYFGDYSYESGIRAAEYYLENEKDFTAVVCASDIMAQGLIARMKQAGKQVPADFSVVGDSTRKL